MSDQLRLFLLQLQEQVGSLRQIVLRDGGVDGAGSAAARAVLATRLLGGSSELMGITPLAAWLRDLLGWLEERGDLDDGLAAEEAGLLREVVALEEQLIDRIAADEDASVFLTDNDLARWRCRFSAASQTEVAPEQARPSEIRLVGLDDLRAALSADAFLDIVERLVTKVPTVDGPAAVSDGEPLRLGERWQRARSLCEALFRALGVDAGRSAGTARGATAQASEAEIPEGLSRFRAALLDGFREGLTAVGVGGSAGDQTPRLLWLPAETYPLLACSGSVPAGQELLSARRQAVQGRALGLIAADLTSLTAGEPPWTVGVHLSGDRFLIDYQRPPGRLSPEAHRVMAHLWSDEYLLELPNLRAALRQLSDEGVLVLGSFGTGHKGHLRLSLPVQPEDRLSVLVIPLGSGRAAVPSHLVEEVAPLAGWRQWVDEEGERLARDGLELPLIDAASWVDALLPIDPLHPASRVVVAGKLDKRVALLAAGLPERAVASEIPGLAGWDAVASRGVRLSAGEALPLLDLERVISLRLCGVAAMGLGGAGDLPVC